MIAGINDNRVNGCSGNKRVISDYRPRSHVAAAIRCFPDAAANRAGIGNDAAVDCRGGIDRNGVNPTFGGRIVKATRAAGHPLWLRAECRKTSRGKRQRIGPAEFSKSSGRDAAGHSRVLSSGSTHPCWVEPAGRIRQAILPVLFQLGETRSFAL